MNIMWQKASRLLERNGYKEVSSLLIMLGMEIDVLERLKEKMPNHNKPNQYDMMKLFNGEDVVFSKENRETNAEKIRMIYADNPMFDKQNVDENDINKVLEILSYYKISFIEKIINKKKTNRLKDFKKRARELYEYSFNYDIEPYIKRFYAINSFILSENVEMSNRDIKYIHEEVLQITQDLLDYTTQRDDFVLNFPAVEGSDVKMIVIEAAMRLFSLSFFTSYDEYLMNMKMHDLRRDLSPYKPRMDNLKENIISNVFDGNEILLSLVKKYSVRLSKKSSISREKLEGLDNPVFEIISDFGNEFKNIIIEMKAENLTEAERKEIIVNIFHVIYGEEFVLKNLKDIESSYREIVLKDMLLEINNNRGVISVKKKL